jgi:hypothetical protein
MRSPVHRMRRDETDPDVAVFAEPQDLESQRTVIAAS